MTDPAEISLVATGDRNTLIGWIGNIEVFSPIIQFTSLQALEQKQKLNKNSPYKGLKSFDADDRKLFFGRDVFLKERFEELNRTNAILILGASGSGKSSLVRAGMIPRLRELKGSQFIDLTFIPNQDPFTSFYYCLHAHYPKLDCQFLLEGKSETLVRAVTDLKPANDFWFIFIDQFEELFTLSQQEKRDRFIDGLVQLVRMLDKLPNSDVKIVATMRADFLDRLSPYPTFIKLTDRHRPIVAEMQSDELRLAIEQPAFYHGVTFENGLVEEIIKNLQGQAGYLPLLQYTLDRLWQIEVETSHIDDRILNTSNYRNLGGVSGTLQKHVEEVYQKLLQPEQLAVKRIFLKLVGIGGDETAETEWKPIRCRANRSEFKDPLEQKMVAKLVNENLLVSSGEEQSRESTIEIAHEVLLTAWTTLSAWIRDNRISIALRNRLNNDVKLWQAKKTQDELWSGLKLEQVIALRKDQNFNQILGGFNPEANDFIDASINRRKHQRYRTIAVWTGFSTLALLSATLFISLGTPSLARTFNSWGWDEYSKNNPKKAMENYEIALNIKSDYPLPLLNMGYIYEDKGDFESAAKMYNNAISVSSKKFAPAYNALARLYIMGKLQKGDLNQDQDTLEAIKLLDTAWRLPVDKKLSEDYLKDYELQKSLMIKNLGWANLKLHNYSKSEFYLNQAIKLDSKRASSYCVLAIVFEEQSKADVKRNARQLALEAWKSCKEKAEDDNPDEMKWKQMAEERLNKNANNKDN